MKEYVLCVEQLFDRYASNPQAFLSKLTVKRLNNIVVYFENISKCPVRFELDCTEKGVFFG
jgi:hypothetical protein